MPALSNPAALLKAHVEKYGGQSGGLQRLNGEQCAQIMRLVRKIIEKEKAAADFPFAKMYGDWLQHNDVNNPIVLSIIERINVWFSDDIPVDLIVPKALGFAELRQELIQLFDQTEAPDNLLQTGSLWMQFGSLLLEELAECPASFTETLNLQKKSKAILERIYNRSVQRFGDPGKGKPVWFDRLVIEREPDPEDYFLWRLEFTFPDGSRWGVRGRMLFVDPNPFRVNDLRLRYGASRAETLTALGRAFERSQAIDRIVPVSGPEQRHREQAKKGPFTREYSQLCKSLNCKKIERSKGSRQNSGPEDRLRPCLRR